MPLPAWTYKSSERQPLLNKDSPFAFVHQRSQPPLKRVLSAPFLTEKQKTRRSSDGTYGSATATPRNSVATTAQVFTASESD